MSPPSTRRWLTGLLPIVLIVALGAALRFYRIGELPPGLYRDEGHYGLDALRVLDGDFSIYFAANNGREGLFMYVLAASIALFGRTPEALRAASAFVGTLTIVAIYFAGRNMFSPRIGALSAAILAVTFWHLAISRVAFRAITLPLMLCVMLGLLFAGLRAETRRRRAAFAGLAGAAFGLTFYTYTSAQFVLPLVALYGLSLGLSLRRQLIPDHDKTIVWRHCVPAIAFIAAGLAALAPLLLWLGSHANLYFGRAGQVSVLNPAINNGDLLGTLVANVGKAAGMFTFQGDRIWRHNLSLRPVFTDWLAPAFVFGLAVCVWRWIQSERARADAQAWRVEANLAPQFVLLWLAVMLIPTILSEDTPHFLRAIGALPAACVIAAVGMEAALAWLSRRGILAGLTTFLRRVISPPAFVAALLISWSSIGTIGDYFNDYVYRDLTRYWLEDHNVQLARLINTQALDHARPLPSENIWLEDRLASDNPSLAFLAGGRWVSVSSSRDDNWSHGRDSQLPVLLIVDPNHDWNRLRGTLPTPAILSVIEGPLAQGDNDPSPRRAFIGIHAIPEQADQADRRQALARFEGGISLESATVKGALRAANLYTVTLTWSAARSVSEDYAIFVHWLRGGRPQPMVQDDSSPARGHLPMPAWRVGDRIVDEHTLAVPGGAQPGDVISVGVYRRADNHRLSVLDAQGKPTADSIIIPVSQ